MNDERSNGSVPLIPLSSSRRRDYARLSEDNDNYSYNDNDNDSNFRDHNYASQKHNNLDIDTSYQGPRSYTYPQQEQHHHYQHHQQQPPTMMSNLRSAAGASKKGSISVMASYAFDWAIILVVLGIAYWWNDHEPNRRPFSLEDPNIS